MTRERVVVTGAGAMSPLGTGAEALWRGLLEGRGGVQRSRRLDEAGLDVTTGGEVESFATDVIATDADVIALARARERHRGVVIATRSIDEALGQAGLVPAACGFVWGTALDTYEHVAPASSGSGAQLVQRSAGATFASLAREFAAPRRMIALACATGTAAIGEAFRLVRSGRVATCVAGGSSTMLGAFYLIGFHALRAVAADVEGEAPDRACKPFDRERRGFALSDGAGALVIEALSSARRRGAEPIGEIFGYGVSQDAYDLNRPPADGAGALRCIQHALADAGLAADDVDAVNAHGTGTQVGDLAETAALRALFGDRAVPVASCKGALGHTMAAAGALETLAALASCRSGLVPATRNLVEPDPACAADHVIGTAREVGVRRVLKTSFGMGGQNAALVVGRYVG